MAAVMTVSLAACGSSGATTAEPAADSSTEAKAETDADAADADTEAASAEDGESYDELLEEIIPEETVTLDVFDQLAITQESRSDGSVRLCWKNSMLS